MEEIVVTSHQHGLSTGTLVRVKDSPCFGLSVDINYYAIVLSENSLKLAYSFKNAMDGIAIVGTGPGIMSVHVSGERIARVK